AARKSVITCSRASSSAPRLRLGSRSTIQGHGASARGQESSSMTTRTDARVGALHWPTRAAGGAGGSPVCEEACEMTARERRLPTWAETGLSSRGEHASSELLMGDMRLEQRIIQEAGPVVTRPIRERL